MEAPKGGKVRRWVGRCIYADPISEDEGKFWLRRRIFAPVEGPVGERPQVLRMVLQPCTELESEDRSLDDARGLGIGTCSDRGKLLE